MHSKVKMTSQIAENLVHVQQHHGKHFHKKLFFLYCFIQLIWPFECLILTILTLTKSLQNLLRDSILPVIITEKKSISQVVLIMLKMPIETFFLTTLYMIQKGKVSHFQARSFILRITSLVSRCGKRGIFDRKIGFEVQKVSRQKKE